MRQTKTRKRQAWAALVRLENGNRAIEEGERLFCFITFSYLPDKLSANVLVKVDRELKWQPQHTGTYRIAFFSKKHGGHQMFWQGISSPVEANSTVSATPVKT